MSTATQEYSYSSAIREGFRYLLSEHPNVFCLGQGLWAPWYVGTSMLDLDKEFGKERVIDSPVSEVGCTGAGVGAALCGFRPIIIHPRVDFMILAVDQIVSQAAKWSHMFGGQSSAGLTIRGIINRGGEQGAQHSQALQSWFAHIPGLKVVMPATVADARDLLVASVLDDAPVLYIDDRWCYEQKAHLPPTQAVSLKDIRPQVLREGSDVTLVGSSYSTMLCQEAADLLAAQGISCEVVDLRVLNPLQTEALSASVEKTGNLVVVDGSWRTCGVAGEVVARVFEDLGPSAFRSRPQRVCLPSTLR